MLLTALFILAMVIWIRNELVFRERMKMIDTIFSQEEWKYYESFLEVIGYPNMLFHFWVWPISKMWPQELKDLT